eukprot:CAMPEP_0170190808 /NCGR_PEP_ID=MMETSP0040_2-20121228/50178_1 /TAXON_ID=641309 /ORGANISM="Lotharella oceanica, Strain CCMP622" /LENGTH=403 /DNA_ID=CAMNT_0010438747 /DNA_START=89 /DNA_END=1300 /DNA_ORIENTATION=-
MCTVSVMLSKRLEPRRLGDNPKMIKVGGERIKQPNGMLMFKYVEVPAENHEPMIELESREIRRIFSTRTGSENYDTWADDLLPDLKDRLGITLNRSEIIQDDEIARDWDKAVDSTDEEDADKKTPADEQQDPEIAPDYSRAFNCNIGIQSLVLLDPKPENNHTAVSLLYDDKFLTKKLPLNQRATDIAIASGENSKIYGNAYLTRWRQLPKTRGQIRLNFTLKDCSSDAPWIKEAREDSRTLLHEGEKAIPGAGVRNPRDRLPPNRQFAPKDFTCEKDEEIVGGINERYNWTQTKTYCMVNIPLPPDTTKKDVTVRITATSLHASARGRLLVDGDLHSRVYLDSAMWCIDSGMLQVSLDKCRPDLWPWLLLPSEAMTDAVILERGERRWSDSLARNNLSLMDD